ncbi:hypothetical protein MGN70_006848 [Eutypa lata]|nr:hypothetical protein MGN70_006848 [Eutypa lata]
MAESYPSSVTVTTAPTATAPTATAPTATAPTTVALSADGVAGLLPDRTRFFFRLFVRLFSRLFFELVVARHDFRCVFHERMARFFYTPARNIGRRHCRGWSAFMTDDVTLVPAPPTPAPTTSASITTVANCAPLPGGRRSSGCPGGQ